jgi:tRNA (mo5U34)-methyltransferase
VGCTLGTLRCLDRPQRVPASSETSSTIRVMTPQGEPGTDAWLDGLRAEVATRTWFHTIDLGYGVLTPGKKDTLAEVAHMRFPSDLTGQTVLDIGAYDGFYSFEAESRGASTVVATDSWCWNWADSDARRNFDLAHEVLGSRVDTQVVAVEDLTPEVVGGTFDVVLFLGVLYHAPDPLGYLERVRSVTAGLAIIETVVDLLDIDVPAAAYYPRDMLNGDASNHFGPNPLAVQGMLSDAGFDRVVTFAPWSTSKEWAARAQGEGLPRSLGDKVRRKLRRNPRSGRMVFHAFV